MGENRGDGGGMERRTNLVRFLCTKFHVGGMDVTVTNASHRESVAIVMVL